MVFIKRMFDEDSDNTLQLELEKLLKADRKCDRIKSKNSIVS